MVLSVFMSSVSSDGILVGESSRRAAAGRAELLAKKAENEPLQVCPLSAYRSPRYFFYIIQNVLTQKRYVGICANLERRLQQHSIAENTFLGPGSKTLVRSGEVEGAADLKTAARRE